MIADMRQTEEQLQMIMRGLADELYREISEEKSIEEKSIEEKSLKEALDGINRTEKALDGLNNLNLLE